MSEQEKKVLYYCREWYRTGKDVIKQALWFEIGVMLENETDAEQNVQADICPRCEGVGSYCDYIGVRQCGLCGGTGKCR